MKSFIGLFFITSGSMLFAQQNTAIAQQNMPIVQQNMPIKPEIYGYHYWVPQVAKEYLQKVDQGLSAQAKTSSLQSDLQCQNLTGKMLADGHIDIRYALGYFDDSQAKTITYDGFDYGLSPSLDQATYEGLRKVFTTPCESSTMQTCGFVEVQDSSLPYGGQTYFVKQVKLFGQKVDVQISLTKASASESYQDNKSVLSAQQAYLARQSEANFFDKINTSDVVIYNGHSRNGGGPDFNPPILDKSLHVNYNGYYLVKKTGIKRILNQIQTNPNKDSILGLFACYSEKHYLSQIKKVNPGQKLILSTDTIDYYDSLRASLGLIEAVMRGRCSSQGINQIFDFDEKLQTGYRARNF